MIAIMSDPLTATLCALADREVSLRDGEQLFRSGAPVRNVYVLAEGSVELLRFQKGGDSLMLQRASAGDLLAEASIFAARYHCDAYAKGATRVLRVPRARVDQLREDDPQWLSALASRLARELQRARARAELLSLKRVDLRVNAWLDLNGGELPERGQWVGLALELGVTPEALYRELARRRGKK
jgi:CRP/FNR family transcriptional regulator, dissimilatory nitrate respiration regulator